MGFKVLTGPVWGLGLIFGEQEAKPNTNIRWPQDLDPREARVFAQNVIEINASPEKVWSVLVDCTAWPKWYKHCSDVSILKGGNVLGPDSQFRFKTLGYFFEPRVEVFEASRMLAWSAQGPAGTSGAHAWLIEPTPDGCRVTTEEIQNGLLLAFMAGSARNNMLKVHEEWLRGLKELAEEK